MKRTSKALLSTLLMGMVLSTAACGSDYEGAATVVEKNKESRYVQMGNSKVLRHDYEVRLCPETAVPTSEQESVDCFWETVTSTEYNDIAVDDVVAYTAHDLQR